MAMIPLLIFFLLIFGYALISRRLETTFITAPIFFTVAGMLMFPKLPTILEMGFNANIFLQMAEIGLVLLLFTDASRTDFKLLRSTGNLPVRLLSGGMLLTLLLGAVAARLVFPKLSLWEAGILAAILAPTDAGLGQVIVNSSRVPMRIRQALNVEAGLNDGLSVPFLLFFMALAAAKVEGGAASLAEFIWQQLGYGLVVGATIGLAGGWLLDWACRREWVAEPFRQVGVVALPMLCMLVSDIVGASMFIAAFVAGLTVQVAFKDAGKHSVEFTEEWGQLFNLSVFFLFGFLLLKDWRQYTWATLLYAALSLTVVRMIPVAIALMGTRLSRASVLFMGWFGPRGLASIVLGLVYMEQGLYLPGEHTIQLAVILTVGLSIFAHGLSAVPGIALYERKLARLGPDAPEH
jgi:NhaP-type Na+/H+ or K+/H+ antiporter